MSELYPKNRSAHSAEHFRFSTKIVLIMGNQEIKEKIVLFVGLLKEIFTPGFMSSLLKFLHIFVAIKGYEFKIKHVKSPTLRAFMSILSVSLRK